MIEVSDLNDYYKDASLRNNISNSYYFSVFVMKKIIIAYAIGLCIPFIFFILSFRLTVDLIKIGEKSFVTYFVWVLLFILFFFAFFGIECIGKRLDVLGSVITIKKFFVIKDEISLYNINKCEVITGLVSHSKYRTYHYNKAVIYYSDNKKVSFTDTTYIGWEQLVDYMESNGKAVYIDGRSAFSKYLDNKFGR